jgi:uncharacterized protein YacL
MWLHFFRALVVALLVYSGWEYSPFPEQPAAGALVGAVAALFVFLLQSRLETVPGPRMVGGLVGGVLGLLGARLFWSALDGVDVPGEPFFHVFLVVFFGYMGLVVGVGRGEWFEPARMIAAFRESSRLRQYKLLDTSVIIDGRIADICETGFLDGVLVAPQFVLRELQQVADSSDSLKRNRGRRGLDILQRIQKMSGVHVQIVETDFPEIREVDLKLIELARKMDGKIVTNDFNLNKVAQLRGVQVLNINELANSLKPVVLPGEVMRVFVLKEGKEAGQGVGYLDDGTMVVVDQGRKALGRTIEVTVTSVLQTTAGKMIFCRPGEVLEATTRRDEGLRDDAPRRERRRNGRARNDRENREAERPAAAADVVAAEPTRAAGLRPVERGAAAPASSSGAAAAAPKAD